MNTPIVDSAWARFSRYGSRSDVDIWEIARELEIKLITAILSSPQNPCTCVADGDNGTLAHLCEWHKKNIKDKS